MKDGTFMKENRFFNWVRINKTKIIIVGVSAVGAVIAVSSRNSISKLFHQSTSAAIESSAIDKAIHNIPVPKIPNDILNNLTGEKMTARDLGNLVGCSAQQINKRIVSLGLATKQPCGEYLLTEAGRLLGKETLKTTSAGHTFSNIEWDKKVLDLIFNTEIVSNSATNQ